MQKSANPDRDVLGVAVDGRPGREYDEGTFLYFLALEQARADRLNHISRLLLATLESEPGKPVWIDRVDASRLFAGLRLSLRDTDVIGWYRKDRVAAAVLTDRVDALGWKSGDPVVQRVGDALRQRLPPTVARMLRVRITELRPRFPR